jgi:hypothetical protein
MTFQSFSTTTPIEGGGGGGGATPITVAGLRSSIGYATTTETNICNEALVIDCRISLQTPNIITSGDRMYETDGVTPFNGSQGTGRSYGFFNVVLSISTEANESRVCYIDENGFMSVNTICPI